MDGAVIVGFLKVVGISLAPVAIAAVVINAPTLMGAGVAAGRRLHLLRPPPAAPDGPPLETLASNLRRLRPRVHSPRPGVAIARQRGIVAAYDGVLVSTARALEVPTTLGELPDGIDQEAERLRLEDALEQAGLSWQIEEH